MAASATLAGGQECERVQPLWTPLRSSTSCEAPTGVRSAAPQRWSATCSPKPELFSALIDATTAPDPVVRMRAADAAGKVTRRRSDLLNSCKQRLLDGVAAVPQQEVRWHVAQMLPRLALTTAKRERAVEIPTGDPDDEGSIEWTFSMHGEDWRLQVRARPLTLRASAGAPKTPS